MYELKVTEKGKVYTATLNKPTKETIAKALPYMVETSTQFNIFEAGEIFLNETIITENSDLEILKDDTIYVSAVYGCIKLFKPVPYDSYTDENGLNIIKIKDEDKEYKLTLNQMNRKVHGQISPLLSKNKIIAIGEIIIRNLCIETESDKDIIFKNDDYYISVCLAVMNLISIHETELKKK